MQPYPKHILNLQQQLETYVNAGMDISPKSETEKALRTIGYYRLRGYCFQLYNNETKRYRDGTKFSDIVSLYRFDTELSHLIFGMLNSIEISLRVRLVEALLVHNDALILNDPAVFDDKKLYWQNHSALSSEIARSEDVFIKHNYDKHEGLIPVWAAVEVMSFGTLSKTIKNLKTGSGSSYSVLADYYKFRTKNGNMARPSKQMLSSWIHAASIVRNICAHNGRLYNRSIIPSPELTYYDRKGAVPRFTGLYQVLLAMKYLRPNDEEWKEFVKKLVYLLNKYKAVINMRKMNFPWDWKKHFSVDRIKEDEKHIID